MLDSDVSMMRSTSLFGQNILITGAAGRIGTATAKQALDAGANVVLVDISRKELDRLVSELSVYDSDRFFDIVGDTSTADGIDSLVSQVSISYGTIDGAVHCAYPRSKGWGAKFESFQADDLFDDIGSQLGGAILISRRMVQLFQSQGHGNLVHLSSIQGVQAPKFDHYIGTNMSSPIEYSAIKSGVISITRWLAKYTANQNIRVNCVSPGGILDSQPSEFLSRYRQSCSNIGMLSASQVASTIVFLLSPDSAAINGQNIVVDDGWTL